MQDRVSLYPGRIKLTPVSGQNNVYDMERADQPTQEGTALNKANLLKDATAALFGLGANAVPDDVFNAVKTALNNHDTAIAAAAKIATGSYTGTDTYGASNPNSLTFDFAPKVVFYLGRKDSDNILTHLINTNATTNRFMMPMGEMPTSYKMGWGFGYTDSSSVLRGQRSGDGKTISWYNSSNAGNQNNSSAYTYYYLAIG